MIMDLILFLDFVECFIDRKLIEASQMELRFALLMF